MTNKLVLTSWEGRQDVKQKKKIKKKSEDIKVKEVSNEEPQAFQILLEALGIFLPFFPLTPTFLPPYS